VNRYFDVPWLAYTEKGVMADGPLATDRPHTSNSSAPIPSTASWEEPRSPSCQFWSGSPLTSQINAVSSTPVYPYGRGDMGRTSVYFRPDLNLMHEFKPFSNNEAMKLRVELYIYNLFNSSTVTNKYQDMLHGRRWPARLLPTIRTSSRASTRSL